VSSIVNGGRTGGRQRRESEVHPPDAGELRAEVDVRNRVGSRAMNAMAARPDASPTVMPRVSIRLSGVRLPPPALVAKPRLGGVSGLLDERGWQPDGVAVGASTAMRSRDSKSCVAPTI
jgi:hypothetical protein